jgi:ClpP class serine protease
LQSKEVRSIIFYIDSPGGQVTGVQELASLIYESRAIKPIKGYVYGQGASAAYNIVSATSEIISADTAIVGSIGVLSAVKDTREKDRKEGVRTVEFVSSVSPNKTLNFEDDKSLSKVQRMVDALGKVMVENIARFRGVSSETILQQYGQGDVFVGQTALDRRLVDRIGTFESLVNEMDTSSRAFTGTGIVSSTITKGGGSMDLETLKSQHPDVYNAAVAIGKQEAEASFAGKLEAARADGAKAERERIQNIESIKVPGAQAVIEKMKFDPKATKESVAVAVLEDQQKRTETAAGRIGNDAQALANQVGQVATGQEEGTDTNASAEEKAALDAMVDGINKK